MNENRPTWHTIWMSIASIIAQRSYDGRLKVGTIIVSSDNTTVLSIGFNGNYAGGPNEPSSNEEGKSEFLHSEINALLKCDFHFHKDKILYVTHFPCRMCCKAIINSGIKTVIYNEEYRDMSGLSFFKDANINVLHHSELI
jgi:dCMP deaminase